MISVGVSHLMIYTKLQCCGSAVDCFVDPSCIVDLSADPPHVSLVDLLADPHVDLIFLLPLCNMVSPLLERSMHLWTEDWVMCWPLSQRTVACIFSFPSQKCKEFTKYYYPGTAIILHLSVDCCRMTCHKLPNQMLSN